MKIVSLEAENVKRLKAVRIVPSGSSVVIGGMNGNGKSSVLDSIAYAIGGKDLVCEEPVRTGEKRAKVVCDLGEYVVTRTFTPGGGGTLKVTNADGAAYGSPQTLLDGLFGSLSFDPLAFSRMKPKEQSETLRRLVGLDTSAIDAERARIFAERTDAGRMLKSVAAQADAAQHFPGAPESEVSIKDLAAQLRVARDYNEGVNAAERAIDQCVKTIERLTAELDRARGALDVARQRRDEQSKKAPGPVDALGLVDVMGMESMMSDAESQNAKVRANAAKAKLDMERSGWETKVSELTQRIESIDRAKVEKMKAVKFPIDGLSIGDAGATFDGLPLEQASQAQKIRVSMAIGLAMNPKLRVVLIRDGSLLDAQSLSVVEEMAVAADAQVWIERVGEGRECSVIIEDGSVKSGSEAVPAEVAVEIDSANEKPF